MSCTCTAPKHQCTGRKQATVAKRLVQSKGHSAVALLLPTCSALALPELTVLGHKVIVLGPESAALGQGKGKRHEWERAWCRVRDTSTVALPPPTCSLSRTRVTLLRTTSSCSGGVGSRNSTCTRHCHWLGYRRVCVRTKFTPSGLLHMKHCHVAAYCLWANAQLEDNWQHCRTLNSTTVMHTDYDNCQVTNGTSANTRTCMTRVRVSGGRGRHARSISATAALQLPWQSKSALTMPPFTMPAADRHGLQEQSGTQLTCSGLLPGSTCNMKIPCTFIKKPCTLESGSHPAGLQRRCSSVHPIAWLNLCMYCTKDACSIQPCICTQSG